MRITKLALLLLLAGCSQQPPAQSTSIESIVTETSTTSEPTTTEPTTTEPTTTEPTTTEPLSVESNEKTDTAHTTEKTEKAMTEVPYTNDSLGDIKKAVADGSAILIDVRTQEEWDESHLAVSKLIPSGVIQEDNAERAAALEQLDKEKPVYIHCKKGSRAGRSAQILAALGYDARPMKIEYPELVEGGFDVAK